MLFANLPNFLNTKNQKKTKTTTTGTIMTTRIGRWNVRKDMLLSRIKQESSTMCFQEIESLFHCAETNVFNQGVCAGLYTRALVCLNRQKVEARKTKNALGTLGYQFSRFNQKGMKQFKNQKV
jgi:hypothetical protein